jgi:hypothetical protein
MKGFVCWLNYGEKIVYIYGDQGILIEWLAEYDLYLTYSVIALWQLWFQVDTGAQVSSHNTAQARPQTIIQIVHLNPRCSGIRIPAMDDISVRGISELVLLKKVLDRAGLKLPAADYFDLIIGTSKVQFCAKALTSIRWPKSSGIISLAITSSGHNLFIPKLVGDFMARLNRYWSVIDLIFYN